MNPNRLMTILLVMATTAVAGWTQEPVTKNATVEAARPAATEPSATDEDKSGEEYFKPDHGTVQSWEEFVADWMTPSRSPKGRC